ncbi:hypothetical protein ACFQ1L_15365 [Phytohabitans flavus]|uniref:hypothetical protein n=1 Tax=Phytohabitans flavus TaxID=1076124 RepID=UPI00362CCA72
MVVAAVFRNFGAAGAPFHLGCSNGSSVAVDPAVRIKVRRQKLPQTDDLGDVGTALQATLSALWDVDDTVAVRPTIEAVAPEVKAQIDDEQCFTGAIAAGFAWNLLRLGDSPGRSQGMAKIMISPLGSDLLFDRIRPAREQDLNTRRQLGQVAIQAGVSHTVNSWLMPMHLLGVGAEYLPRGVAARTVTASGQARWTIADPHIQLSLTPAGRIWLLAHARLSGTELLEDALPPEPSPSGHSYIVNFHDQVTGSAFAVGDQAKQVVHIHNDGAARDAVKAILDLVQQQRAGLVLSAEEAAELDESLAILQVSLTEEQPASALRLAALTISRIAGDLFVGAAGNAVWEGFKAAIGI